MFLECGIFEIKPSQLQDFYENYELYLCYFKGTYENEFVNNKFSV